MRKTATPKDTISSITDEHESKIKRIAFLGGASWGPESDVYRDAYETSKLLALAGYGIVNGGGPGVMRASTLGAHDAGKRAFAVTYHPNKTKRHYEGVDPLNTFDDEVVTLDYFDRTKVMLQTTDLHIIFKGSIGTLSEFGMTWISSWIHEPDNKPIILFGDFWGEFLEFFRKHFIMEREEEHMMKICLTPKEVLDYVKSLG
jgi:predicted Rossmann-fold nucleotide-binding protein